MAVVEADVYIVAAAVAESAAVDNTNTLSNLDGVEFAFASVDYYYTVHFLLPCVHRYRHLHSFPTAI